MKKITISASKTYDILIGSGLLDEAGCMIAGIVNGRSAAIVTDDQVETLYSGRLEASLVTAGFNVVRYVVPHGEFSKNAANFISLLNLLADARLTRADAVIALGGGVVGDLAGFAASSYMRGIGFIQIPTTLLAAVDSSVGGKTAIDLDSGKNLAGSFYQPDLVLCDHALLDTLSRDCYRDGLAEVIKYGVIADEKLFDMLKPPIKLNIEEIIARCVTIKRDVVIVDEKEQGPRKLLNFGHTIGHAVEVCSHYEISHGKSVAIGMSVIARASSKMGLCDKTTSEQIVSVIKSFGLPVTTGFSAKELSAAALGDKKRSGSLITLVVPEQIGQCVLRETPVGELEYIIALGL
ncbi:MAG: 3-dehydroquinate synthase [Clostridiales bacterium]|nr:3-dehydroquinate synthase [Clostridiales bacterium]